VLQAEPSLISAEKLAELRGLQGREFLEALDRALPALDLPFPRKVRGPDGDGRWGGKPHERSGDGPRPRPGFGNR